jgi:hypothetical protein
MGLLTDPRAIGADFRYVNENLAITLCPLPKYSITERVEAGILGVGLGAITFPKTIGQLSKPNGLWRLCFGIITAI